MSLRNFFTLKHCDLPTIMWHLETLMRPMMMRIDQRNTKPIPLIFYALALVITACYIYVYIFSMAWFVFVRCLENDDLDAALIAFSLGTIGNIGFFKALVLMYNQKSIRHIVHESLLLDSKVIPGSRYDKTLKGHMRVVKKRALVFWFVFVAIDAVYVTKPIVLPGRQTMEESFVLYGLEPMLESPQYEISYCINFIAIFFTSYVLSNISALQIITTGIIETQMVALTEELLNVFSDAEESYQKYKNNDDHMAEKNYVEVGLKMKEEILNRYIKDSLSNIVEIHTKNIYLLGKIEAVMRDAMALEFFLLLIGSILQLLSGLENMYLELPYTLLVVAMDCLIGQRVTEAGTDFETAVYNSKWENFDVVNRKIILLMLLDSQKTMKLSAGRIVTLNYPCIMAFLRFIYSTYASIRSMI